MGIFGKKKSVVGRTYTKEIEISDDQWKKLKNTKKKGLSFSDCFKCEDDIKI